MRKSARGCCVGNRAGPVASASLRDRYFLDLFAGSGGVARSSQQKGLTCYAWDVRLGDKYDILSESCIRKLQKAVYTKQVAGIMFAPPCLSFSIARNRTKLICGHTSPKGIFLSTSYGEGQGSFARRKPVRGPLQDFNKGLQPY